MTKKEKVLKIGLELFAKQGFENTTIDNICKEANVSKGLIYHHFKSKNDILKALFGNATEKMKELNERFTSNPPRENIVMLISAIFKQLEDEKLMFRLNLNVMFQPSTREILSEEIKERSEMLFKYVKRNFDEISVEQSNVLSYLFIAEIDGIALDYLSVYENYPLHEMKNYLINKYKNIL